MRALIRSKFMARPLKWISRQDARHRFAIALIAGGTVWFGLRHHVRLTTASIAAWDTFALCTLALAWLTISTTPPAKLRTRAQMQDLSHMVIFVFVIFAACAGLFAVGFLFYTNKGVIVRSHFSAHLGLSLLAVISSWMLVHTVFGLRYAHTFYGDSDDPEARDHAGGLRFPGDRMPDYLDFAYFSFVIGMTFQVSDVVITAREFRHLVLLHGMLAFAFNTVILALMINTVTTLL
ncbi:MAG: hypothetical protein QOI04_1814 [Verrucomicrobiota bacterium]|jgi:uncharacterized membrane protein